MGDAAKDPRETLRDAALAIEQARRPLRHESAGSACTSARWTLIDQFESHGQRFVIARANGLPNVGLEPLTRREEQVLSLLALGCTSKVVAYELGIAPSTVRVLLLRASKKLEASSTAEAVVAYRRLALTVSGC